ncbi:MAG TPA: hypothetical protein VNX01_02585 [Bacteroidia bacterium]|jgi:hypothetical protein|nr:hypothetical protein [Bacteroidia bacterium]
MDIAVIYELSDPMLNDRVLVELRSMGYLIQWSDSGTGLVYLLPKFMVWKKNIPFQQGIEEINLAINRINAATPTLNLRVIKCITLNAFPWAGIPMSSPI